MMPNSAQWQRSVARQDLVAMRGLVMDRSPSPRRNGHHSDPTFLRAAPTDEGALFNANTNNTNGAAPHLRRHSFGPSAVGNQQQQQPPQRFPSAERRDEVYRRRLEDEGGSAIDRRRHFTPVKAAAAALPLPEQKQVAAASVKGTAANTSGEGDAASSMIGGGPSPILLDADAKVVYYKTLLEKQGLAGDPSPSVVPTSAVTGVSNGSAASTIAPNNSATNVSTAAHLNVTPPATTRAHTYRHGHHHQQEEQQQNPQNRQQQQVRLSPRRHRVFEDALSAKDSARTQEEEERGHHHHGAGGFARHPAAASPERRAHDAFAARRDALLGSSSLASRAEASAALRRSAAEEEQRLATDRKWRLISSGGAAAGGRAAAGGGLRNPRSLLDLGAVDDYALISEWGAPHRSHSAAAAAAGGGRSSSSATAAVAAYVSPHRARGSAATSANVSPFRSSSVGGGGGRSGSVGSSSVALTAVSGVGARQLALAVSEAEARRRRYRQKILNGGVSPPSPSSSTTANSSFAHPHHHQHHANHYPHNGDGGFAVPNAAADAATAAPSRDESVDMSYYNHHNNNNSKVAAVDASSVSFGGGTAAAGGAVIGGPTEESWLAVNAAAAGGFSYHNNSGLPHSSSSAATEAEEAAQRRYFAAMAVADAEAVAREGIRYTSGGASSAFFSKGSATDLPSQLHHLKRISTAHPPVGGKNGSEGGNAIEAAHGGIGVFRYRSDWAAAREAERSRELYRQRQIVVTPQTAAALFATSQDEAFERSCLLDAEHSEWNRLALLAGDDCEAQMARLRVRERGTLLMVEAEERAALDDAEGRHRKALIAFIVELEALQWPFALLVAKERQARGTIAVIEERYRADIASSLQLVALGADTVADTLRKARLAVQNAVIEGAGDRLGTALERRLNSDSARSAALSESLAYEDAVRTARALQMGLHVHVGGSHSDSLHYSPSPNYNSAATHHAHSHHHHSSVLQHSSGLPASAAPAGEEAAFGGVARHVAHTHGQSLREVEVGSSPLDATARAGSPFQTAAAHMQSSGNASRPAPSAGLSSLNNNSGEEGQSYHNAATGANRSQQQQMSDDGGLGHPYMYGVKTQHQQQQQRAVSPTRSPLLPSAAVGDESPLPPTNRAGGPNAVEDVAMGLLRERLAHEEAMRGAGEALLGLGSGGHSRDVRGGKAAAATSSAATLRRDGFVEVFAAASPHTTALVGDGDPALETEAGGDLTAALAAEALREADAEAAERQRQRQRHGGRHDEGWHDGSPTGDRHQNNYVYGHHQHQQRRGASNSPSPLGADATSSELFETRKAAIIFSNSPTATASLSPSLSPASPPSLSPLRGAASPVDYSSPPFYHYRHGGGGAHGKEDDGVGVSSAYPHHSGTKVNTEKGRADYEEDDKEGRGNVCDTPMLDIEEEEGEEAPLEKASSRGAAAPPSLGGGVGMNSAQPSSVEATAPHSDHRLDDFYTARASTNASTLVAIGGNAHAESKRLQQEAAAAVAAVSSASNATASNADDDAYRSELMSLLSSPGVGGTASVPADTTMPQRHRAAEAETVSAAAAVSLSPLSNDGVSGAAEEEKRTEASNNEVATRRVPKKEEGATGGGSRALALRSAYGPLAASAPTMPPSFADDATATTLLVAANRVPVSDSRAVMNAFLHPPATTNNTSYVPELTTDLTHHQRRTSGGRADEERIALPQQRGRGTSPPSPSVPSAAASTVAAPSSVSPSAAAIAGRLAGEGERISAYARAIHEVAKEYRSDPSALERRLLRLFPQAQFAHSQALAATDSTAAKHPSVENNEEGEVPASRSASAKALTAADSRSGTPRGSGVGLERRPSSLLPRTPRRSGMQVARRTSSPSVSVSASAATSRSSSVVAGGAAASASAPQAQLNPRQRRRSLKEEYQRQQQQQQQQQQQSLTPRGSGVPLLRGASGLNLSLGVAGSGGATADGLVISRKPTTMARAASSAVPSSSALSSSSIVGADSHSAHSSVPPAAVRAARNTASDARRLQEEDEEEDTFETHSVRTTRTADASVADPSYFGTAPIPPPASGYNPTSHAPSASAQPKASQHPSQRQTDGHSRNGNGRDTSPAPRGGAGASPSPPASRHRTPRSTAQHGGRSHSPSGGGVGIGSAPTTPRFFLGGVGGPMGPTATERRNMERGVASTYTVGGEEGYHQHFTFSRGYPSAKASPSPPRAPIVGGGGSNAYDVYMSTRGGGSPPLNGNGGSRATTPSPTRVFRSPYKNGFGYIGGGGGAYEATVLGGGGGGGGGPFPSDWRFTGTAAASGRHASSRSNGDVGAAPLPTFDGGLSPLQLGHTQVAAAAGSRYPPVGGGGGRLSSSTAAEVLAPLSPLPLGYGRMGAGGPTAADYRHSYADTPSAADNAFAGLMKSAANVLVSSIAVPISDVHRHLQQQQQQQQHTAPSGQAVASHASAAAAAAAEQIEVGDEHSGSGTAAPTRRPSNADLFIAADAATSTQGNVGTASHGAAVPAATTVDAYAEHFGKSAAGPFAVSSSLLFSSAASNGSMGRDTTGLALSTRAHSNGRGNGSSADTIGRDGGGGGDHFFTGANILTRRARSRQAEEAASAAAALAASAPSFGKVSPLRNRILGTSSSPNLPTRWGGGGNGGGGGSGGTRDLASAALTPFESASSSRGGTAHPYTFAGGSAALPASQRTGVGSTAEGHMYVRMPEADGEELKDQPWWRDQQRF